MPIVSGDVLLSRGLRNSLLMDLMKTRGCCVFRKKSNTRVDIAEFVLYLFSHAKDDPPHTNRLIPPRRDLRGDDQPCFVEVFYNGYCTAREVASRKP